MSALILAIDQGTHSTRAIVFDAQGRVVAQARQAVDLQARSHSEAEQDPDEILASLNRVVQQVLADPALAGRPVGCAGLATQRSSVVAWDRNTGQALAPVLSWQDRRTAPWIATLASQEQRIEHLTGLRLSPHYGAGKLRWLLDTVPAVAEAARTGRLLMGPLASYLLFHLLQDRPACVDHANASRTLLWNLHTRDWDDELLELFGIPRPVLPACRPVCADYGCIAPGDIPLRAVNGDQTAALYALGAPRDDTLLVNIGTGAFVLLPAAVPRCARQVCWPEFAQRRRRRSLLHRGYGQRGAAALTWAAQRFALTGLEEKLPGWLDDVSEPALFINTVGGLGAPWWRTGPEPYFESRSPSAPEAMVAVIESILFLIQANIGLMCQAAPSVSIIRISGGLANLDALCQRLADLSGLEVQRPPQVEATARGIAWQASGASVTLAGIGTSRMFHATRESAIARPLQPVCRHTADNRMIAGLFSVISCAEAQRNSPKIVPRQDERRMESQYHTHFIFRQDAVSLRTATTTAANSGSPLPGRGEQPEKAGVVKDVQENRSRQRAGTVLEETEHQGREQHQRGPQRRMVDEVQASEHHTGKQVGVRQGSE